jgi:hypothetical protein
MLYHVEESAVSKAASVLGRSFSTYPIFTYILPEHKARMRKLSLLFSFLIRNGQQTGEVVAPSNNLEGISIWVMNAGSRPPQINAVKSGILGLLFGLDRASLRRFIAVGRQKEKTRRKLLSRPYCLLDVIGIDPKFQRQGYARIMLQSKLHELDNQGFPCYLETSSNTNIAIYESYGFSMISQYKLFGVDVFCMMRDSK